MGGGAGAYLKEALQVLARHGRAPRRSLCRPRLRPLPLAPVAPVRDGVLQVSTPAARFAGATIGLPPTAAVCLVKGDGGGSRAKVELRKGVGEIADMLLGSSY